jgi:hypothetical protein
MLGYDHDLFWDQTPRTLSLTFEAHRRKEIREHNSRVRLAWNVAVLSRQRRIEPLRRLLVPDKQPTLAEKIEGLTRWVLATGGKVIYNSSKETEGKNG